MPIDSHPWLKHLEDRLGTDDPYTADQAALRSFTSYSPVDRIDIIERTDRAISDEDNVSLRQKAELLDFSRKLKLANSLLRKAGR